MNDIDSTAPERFILVGSGRLARHFTHYFSLLEIPVDRWSRQEPMDQLLELLKRYPNAALLLAISDSAIETFLASVDQGALGERRQIVHFSGVKSIPGILGVHPLMSFGPHLYADSVYPRIALAVDALEAFESGPMAVLPNPYFMVKPEDRPLYHSLCVVAGNFPQMLWQRVQELAQKLGIKNEDFRPYLQQIVENFIESPEQALTGPFARGDLGSIVANHMALKSHAPDLGSIYAAFIDAQLSDEQKAKIKEYQR